jgi:hypothetical protein
VAANSWADAKGAMIGTAFILAQNALFNENGEINQIILEIGVSNISFD